MKRNRVWQALLSLHLLALVLLGACSSPTEEELSPVVLVTVLGLNSDIVGLRAAATLNTAPAMMEQEYKEGFGPSVVQFQFAVRLPARAQGRFELSLVSLTKEGCYLSENLQEQADVAPGQFVTMTVNLNRLGQPMCPLVLDGKGGLGRISWTSQPPLAPTADSSCDGHCVPKFPIGAEVTLTTAGSVLNHLFQWRGDCTGKGECKLTMNQARQVTAQFAPTLKVNPTGGANTRGLVRIISSPEAIDCGKACASGFAPDTEVTLKVVSSAPACFVGWGAPCSGSGECKVTVKDSLQVEARFADCTVQPSGTSNDLTSIWASSSTDIWAAGSSIAIRSSGSTWAPELLCGTSGSIIYGIWSGGPSSDIIYTTGYEINQYTRSGSCTRTYPPYRLTSVWGSAPNDIWYSASNGRIYRSNDSTSFLETSVTESSISLRRITGRGPSDVWVVGDRGFISHWDGLAWKTQKVNGVTDTLYGVWSTSSNSAWAVGEKGTILRWNGTQWSKVDHKLTMATLRAVWAADSSDVWVVGDSGTIIHWDGSVLVKVQEPGARDYYAVHGPVDPSGKVFWVVGSNGTIVKYNR